MSVPAVLAVNMAVGGITAGVWRLSTGHSFWRGFARGSLAGGAVFTGKRIIAGETPLAWWAGRGIAALGSAEVLNAAEGRRILDRAAVPLGPLRLHVARSSRLHLSLRLDLATSIAAVYEATRPESDFAWKESLATGALVFLAPQVTGAVGSHSAGVITISELLPDGAFPPLERKRGVLSHELIHAAQYDFIGIAWGDPLEDAIARRIPGGAGVRRYVDFGVLFPVHAGLNVLMEPHNRPWEKEAASLASGY